MITGPEILQIQYNSKSLMIYKYQPNIKFPKALVHLIQESRAGNVITIQG